MKNNYLKPIAYWFMMLILILIFSVFLISCKSKMPIVEKQKTEVRIKDSIVITKKEVISSAIADSIKIFVGNIKTMRPDCDSITQNAITELLMRIQTSKRSGDNGYTIGYNQAMKQLEIIIKTAASKNSINDSISVQSASTTSEIIKPILVNKPKTKIEIFLMLSGIIAWTILGTKAVLILRSKLSIV